MSVCICMSLTEVKYTSSIVQVYFNLLNYSRRSILQVCIISKKEIHLKTTFGEIKSAF